MACISIQVQLIIYIFWVVGLILIRSDPATKYVFVFILETIEMIDNFLDACLTSQWKCSSFGVWFVHDTNRPVWNGLIHTNVLISIEVYTNRLRILS